MKCNTCESDFDEAVNPHCYCNTHKTFYCWKCGHENTFPCYEKGISCSVMMLINPSWIVNLRKSIEE